MTLTQMRDAVRSRLGVPANDSFYTDAQLTDFINEALAAASSELDWPWLGAITTFSTVSGTSSYTPPADWARTKSLSIDGYQPMEWRTLADIRSIPSATLGVPRYFTVFGEDLLLSPTPGGAYTIRHDYIVSEAALAADGDTPIMPSQYHYAIVAYATHVAMIRGNEVAFYRGSLTGTAGALLQEYEAWLKRMRIQRRRQTGPSRIHVRPGGLI